MNFLIFRDFSKIFWFFKWIYLDLFLIKKRIKIIFILCADMAANVAQAKMALPRDGVSTCHVAHAYVCAYVSARVRTCARVCN